MKFQASTLAVLIIVFIIVSAFAFVAPAAADSPTPDLQSWMIAAAAKGTGGSTPAQVQNAFKNFQNARALQFQWTTSDQWRGNYEQTVTDFLHAHGCVTCGIADGQLTYPLKIDLPLGISDFIDILPVQFQQFK